MLGFRILIVLVALGYVSGCDKERSCESCVQAGCKWFTLNSGKLCSRTPGRLSVRKVVTDIVKCPVGDAESKAKKDVTHPTKPTTELPTVSTSKIIPATTTTPRFIPENKNRVTPSATERITTEKWVPGSTTERIALPTTKKQVSSSTATTTENGIPNVKEQPVPNTTYKEFPKVSPTTHPSTVTTSTTPIRKPTASTIENVHRTTLAYQGFTKVKLKAIPTPQPSTGSSTPPTTASTIATKTHQGFTKAELQPIPTSTQATQTTEIELESSFTEKETTENSSATAPVFTVNNRFDSQSTTLSSFINSTRGEHLYANLRMKDSLTFKVLFYNNLVKTMCTTFRLINGYKNNTRLIKNTKRHLSNWNKLSPVRKYKCGKYNGKISQTKLVKSMCMTYYATSCYVNTEFAAVESRKKTIEWNEMNPMFINSVCTLAPPFFPNCEIELI